MTEMEVKRDGPLLS